MRHQPPALHPLSARGVAGKVTVVDPATLASGAREAAVAVPVLRSCGDGRGEWGARGLWGLVATEEGRDASGKRRVYAAGETAGLAQRAPPSRGAATPLPGACVQWRWGDATTRSAAVRDGMDVARRSRSVGGRAVMMAHATTWAGKAWAAQGQRG
jgi:hypothetical protein